MTTILSPQSVCRLLSVCWAAGTIAAQEGGADKSSYHLLNPVPADQMRELSPDRPDKTESPYTVDAGHFQLEMDVLTYAWDRHNAGYANVRSESYSIAPINLKAGLCRDVDFQLILDTYAAARDHDLSTGEVEKHRGFGDVTARMKWNFWGNDGGTTAFGVMPFVKLPTNQDHLGNRSVEGGVIFPLAVKLPLDWDMGLMTECDFVRNTALDGYHAEFVNSVTFGHGIYGNLSGFVEFFSAVSAESGSAWVGTVDLGLSYGLTRDIQLDAGVFLGVTRPADDVAPFFGITWRF